MKFEEFLNHPRFETIINTLSDGGKLLSDDEDLLCEIIEGDELNKLFSYIDVFSKNKNNEESKHVVVMSIVNIREKYLRQFALFTMNAFLHQVCYEYETFENKGKLPEEYTPEVTKIKQNIIMEFLKRTFYNPEAFSTIYTPDNNKPKLPYNKPKTFTGFRSIDSANNVVDVDNLTIAPEVIDFIPDMIPDPAPLKIGEIYVPIPTRDFFYNWCSYEQVNYDLLKRYFMDITKITGGFDNTFRIYELFPNNQRGLNAAKELQKNISADTGLSVIIADVDKWVLLETTSQNRKNTNYGGLDKVISDIIETGIEDTKIAKSLLDTRVKQKKKHQAIIDAKKRIAGKTSESLKNIEEYRKEFVESPFTELSQEMKEELDIFEKKVLSGELDPTLIYDNVDKDGVPLNATALRIIAINKDNIKQKEIYIESKNDNDNK